jgi:hypothetical protein
MQVMPMIFNDPGFTPVQLNMHGSVGFGGNNVSNDVKTIQMMLNAVPQSTLSLSQPLVVDGVAGRLTIDAIQRYQQAAKLKVVDGRIDPCGATIRALGSSLISVSRFPNALPIASAPESRFLQFITPWNPPPIQPQIYGIQAVGDSAPQTHTIGSSAGWKVVSMTRSTAGVAWLSGISAQILLERNTDQKQATLQFTGAGVAYSAKVVDPQLLSTHSSSKFASQMYFLGAGAINLPVPVLLKEFAPQAASLGVVSVRLPGSLTTPDVGIFTIGSLGLAGLYQAVLASLGRGMNNNLTGYAGYVSVSGG